MPLEVREIGIHMQVGEAGGQDEAGDEAALPDFSQGDGGAARAQLIEQCVEAVLAELARRAER